MRLFFTSFIVVFGKALFVATIAYEMYVFAAVVSFFLSFSWTFNIKDISEGGMRERLVYSFGAVAGAMAGIFFAKLLSGWITGS
jgi:hypothetical protein